MNDTLQFEQSPFLRRFSAIELLVALVALFVSFPFIESLPSGALIESILLTVVLVSALLAIATRRRILIVAALLALPALIGRWLNHYRPDLVPPEVFLIGGIVFVLFVVGNLLRFVLNAPSVNTEVLCASISAYLLLGLLWTLGYWLIAELIPDAFAFNASTVADRSMKGLNGLYFSFITLSTVGYGDITPVSKVARMLAAAEATTGLLYVAVLIARLVALHATRKSNES
jgi:voltage-gated potassium channel